MNIKGINPFEQHVEKITLGVVVLSVLGIAGWQLLSAPAVQVGTRSVSPDQIDAILKKKAADLDAKLKKTESGDAPKEGVVQIPTDGVDLASPAFTSALQGSVSPVASLARTSPSFNGMLVRDSVSSVDVWFYEPSVPTLQMRGVQETADALTAEDAKEAVKVSKILAARPDFAKIEGPKDVVWTTPFARIDLKQLRAEYAGSRKDANPPLMAVPGVWYQETPYIIDVIFERREKNPATGVWNSPVEIPVFTARSAELTFRGRLGSAAADLRDEVFALLGSDDNQKEIFQPTFYDTVNGAFVSPEILADAEPITTKPSATGSASGAVRRRLQLQTQLQDRQRRSQALRAELEKLGGPWDEAVEKKREEDRKREERERKESEKSGKTGGGGGKGGPGGGGPGGGGGSMSGKNNSTNEDELALARKKMAARKSKTVLLRKFEQEAASIEKELGNAPTVAGAASAARPKLAAMDELLVWGHDLEVEPGHTYQYRCGVRAYNPFFGKGNQLVTKQKEKGIASEFTRDSKFSDWSSDITVSNDVKFFVTNATASDGTLALGSAQFEVYKLKGGQWRVLPFSVQPGDRIGRSDNRTGAQGVDFTTEYFVVDVVPDLAASRASTSGKQAPALVVIGSLTGSGTEIRIPALDLDSPDRAKLRAQADASAAAGKSGDGGAEDAGKPGPGGTPPNGGSAPPKGGGGGGKSGPGAG